jgi:hypothetical protein
LGPTITYYLYFIEKLTESGVRRNRAQVLTTTWVASAQSYHRLKTTQVIPAQSSYTVINMVYAYSQPFWPNFDFLSKIFFFFIKQFLFKNHMQQTVDNNEIIKNKQTNKKKIYSMKSFPLKYFFVILLIFYC